MPSSHSTTILKPPWRWLTAKKKPKPQTNQAPFTQPTPNNNNKDRKPNSENQSQPSLSQNIDPQIAKPEPALHRLQELKSPPPLPSSSSDPDGQALGFKSRPLYRRTHSCPESAAVSEGSSAGGVRGGDVAPVEKAVCWKGDDGGGGARRRGPAQAGGHSGGGGGS